MSALRKLLAVRLLFLLFLFEFLSVLSEAQDQPAVPLNTDCRFWPDPSGHIQLLRQQKANISSFLASLFDAPTVQAPAGLRRRVWYWWSLKAEKCLECQQCEPPDLLTAVPCHYMSDTVCVHRDEMEQFNTERRGYYYAHPDYHQEGGEGEADGYKVYDSEEPKSDMPEVFGRRKFHGNNNNNRSGSKSLTSQIVSQRLSESGQLSFKQKLETFQSGRSDFGRPTFYSGGEVGGGRGTNNAAVSSDARPVLEVAKVFLGDGKQNRKKTLGWSRQRNFGDIRNLFPNKKSQAGRGVRPAEVTPGAILQPPPTTSTTSISMVTLTSSSTTSITRGTPMMSEAEVEVETRQPAEGSGGIHHHLVLAFCLLSILVVVLLSVLAYLVINRGQTNNKFNILDNLGKRSTQTELGFYQLFSSEWEREGREGRGRG